jgi:hypothetical protein
MVLQNIKDLLRFFTRKGSRLQVIMRTFPIKEAEDQKERESKSK